MNTLLEPVRAPLVRAPDQYRNLGMFTDTVLRWLVFSSDASGEIAQRDGAVSSFADREELYRIAGTVHSLVTGGHSTAQEQHLELEALWTELTVWSRGLDTRMMCVFMLTDLKHHFK